MLRDSFGIEALRGHVERFYWSTHRWIYKQRDSRNFLALPLVRQRYPSSQLVVVSGTLPWRQASQQTQQQQQQPQTRKKLVPDTRESQTNDLVGYRVVVHSKKKKKRAGRDSKTNWPIIAEGEQQIGVVTDVGLAP